MLTISNTSPLLYLHLVGQLELLPKLYGEVIVPPAVQFELDQGNRQGVNVPLLNKLPWIRIVPVQSRLMLPLVTDLGAGEMEVIGLALEHPGSRVILDDQLGRTIAKLNQITVTGTLGVVLKAKQEGLLSQVRPVVYHLRIAGLWLDNRLVEWVLSEANE